MDNRKEILSELFDKYRNELKDLNEYLYNNPELGMQEYKACTAHTNMVLKLKKALLIWRQLIRQVIKKSMVQG